jgi:hypothetical protein
LLSGTIKKFSIEGCEYIEYNTPVITIPAKTDQKPDLEDDLRQ